MQYSFSSLIFMDSAFHVVLYLWRAETEEELIQNNHFASNWLSGQAFSHNSHITELITEVLFVLLFACNAMQWVSKNWLLVIDSCGAQMVVQLVKWSDPLMQYVKLILIFISGLVILGFQSFYNKCMQLLGKLENLNWNSYRLLVIIIRLLVFCHP